MKLAATADWQQVVLKISDLVGGEHWGGANDGKWHGPIKAFGLNIGKDSFAAGAAAQGSINIDDVDAVPGPVLDGHPTLLSGVLDPPSCRPGFATRLTYRWDAEPMGRDFTVFVHFVGPDGKMAFQNDHDPAPPTSVWSGRVEYANGILVPTDAPGRRLPDHGRALRPPRRRPRLGPSATEDRRRRDGGGGQGRRAGRANTRSACSRWTRRPRCRSCRRRR